MVSGGSGGGGDSEWLWKAIEIDMLEMLLVTWVVIAN
jgi:hypothetical protein